MSAPRAGGPRFKFNLFSGQWLWWSREQWVPLGRARGFAAWFMEKLDEGALDNPAGVATSTDLYGDYLAYCEAHWIEPASTTKFAISLGETGLAKFKRGDGKVCRVGISLRDQVARSDIHPPVRENADQLTQSSDRRTPRRSDSRSHRSSALPALLLAGAICLPAAVIARARRRAAPESRPSRSPLRPSGCSGTIAEGGDGATVAPGGREP